MLSALLMILLPVKHILLSHVLDVGYSDSRTPGTRDWTKAALIHTKLELITTVFLLYGCALETYCEILITELLALITAIFVERRMGVGSRVRYGRALKAHLIVEAGLLSLYFFLGQQV